MYYIISLLAKTMITIVIIIIMANSKVCFITNNAKGLQLSKKRVKRIEYLKNKIESNGVLFMPVTHCF